MRDYIINKLEDFKRINGRAYRLGIVNWGGTLTCLPIKDYLDDKENKLDRSGLLNENGEFDVEALSKKKDELTPVQNKSELEEILNILGFRDLVESELLEMNIIYHDPQDSSQMTDKDRESALRPLQEEYLYYDGFSGIHGTDTYAKTARFVNMNLPHYDPKENWDQGINASNWTKPFGIVASQEPVARFRNGKFEPVVGSDGAMSMVTLMSILTTDRFGEVGFMISREFVYRASAYFKGSDSHLNYLSGDRGVPPLAERTAFGIICPGVPFDEKSMFQDKTPFVIYGSSEFEDKVLTVSESSHLANIKNYLNAIDSGDEKTANTIKESLPRAVLYESKGGGNVQEEEFEILEKFMKAAEGEVYVLRVPIPGGRVPRTMHYDVPGGKIKGCNIESLTAKYKVQSVLALMNQFNIKKDQRSDFFYKMMEVPFTREKLPTY